MLDESKQKIVCNIKVKNMNTQVLFANLEANKQNESNKNSIKHTSICIFSLNIICTRWKAVIILWQKLNVNYLGMVRNLEVGTSVGGVWGYHVFEYHVALIILIYLLG